MITCDNARQLFDRYLDGELPPGLQTELHAHRLNCSNCQNDLAIMEACGDVIGMDTCEPKPRPSFTDRVILASRAQRRRKTIHWPKVALWAGAPLAAAAAIALAVVGLTTEPPTTELPSVIASSTEAQSKPLRDLMISGRDTRLTEKAMQEMDATPEMATANVICSVLDPIVSSAQKSLTHTHQATAELGLLLDVGLTNTMEKFVDTASEPSEPGNGRPVTSFAPGLPAPLDSPPPPPETEPMPEAL